MGWPLWPRPGSDGRCWTGEEESTEVGDSGAWAAPNRGGRPMSAAQRSTNDELSRFHWSTDLSSDADGGTEEEEGERWLEAYCRWESVSSVGV